MSDDHFRTTLLHCCLVRLQAGDDTAFDDLVRHSGERLKTLADRMLKKNPAVRRWVESEDVLQKTLLRLLKDLREKKKSPPSVRDFFNLASNRIRCVLKDFHRHFHGKYGVGANHASVMGSPGATESSPAALDPPAVATDLAELEGWSAFHEAVEQLDPVQNEVVGLIFYHGWTQVEVAELLQVSPSMVRKHWAKACVRLQGMLGNAMPEM